VIFSLQLLAGNSLICGQATNLQTAISASSPVSKLDTTSTNKAAQNQKYLSQLRKPQACDTGNTGSVTNEVGGDINHLEWTGQYTERFVRVPEGNSGKAKLIRFLVPVYREKGTQRKASVGTGDEQKNLVTKEGSSGN
jgi:hypothetical protein